MPVRLLSQSYALRIICWIFLPAGTQYWLTCSYKVPIIFWFSLFLMFLSSRRHSFWIRQMLSAKNVSIKTAIKREMLQRSLFPTFWCGKHWISRQSVNSPKSPAFWVFACQSSVICCLPVGRLVDTDITGNLWQIVQCSWL